MAVASLYTVTAWHRGTCVWLSSSPQRRAVVSAVKHALADLGADGAFIECIVPAAGRVTTASIAVVTADGRWHWQGAPEMNGALRRYVESL